MKNIYLDYAATTPCDIHVLEAMRPYFFERFGNAASPHAHGRQARKAVETSREVLAGLIGAMPVDIVFTSGASESNNQAIYGALRLRQGKHIIASAIEHKSIIEPLRFLESQGYLISWVKPNAEGIVETQTIADVITPQTALVCMHHANNEIGTIQPVEEIGALCRGRGILFLVDATQTVGHIPVQVDQIGCDFLSLSAHKFYGPSGVGALYVRKGIDIPAFILGGDQERGRRATTHHLTGIVGLGEALCLCQKRMADEATHEAHMRDQIIKEVLQIQGARLNGSQQSRLPNNAHFSFENIDGEELVSALDMAGISVSMGSACTWGKLEPSHVLTAMGLSDRQALGALRVTVGRFTTTEEVQYFLEQLKQKVSLLRKTVQAG